MIPLRGGSSAINGQMYLCGQDLDYDRWNASGALGWDYQKFLPYFKKHENNTDPSKNSSYHGTGGPLTVSTFEKTDNFYDVLEAGFTELDFKKLSDYNQQTYTGFGPVQGTVRNGERDSAYQAYLA